MSVARRLLFLAVFASICSAGLAGLCSKPTSAFEVPRGLSEQDQQKAAEALTLAAQIAADAAESSDLRDQELLLLFSRLSQRLQATRLSLHSIPSGSIAAARTGMLDIMIEESTIRKNTVPFLAQTFIHEAFHGMGFTDECNTTALEALTTQLGYGRLVYANGYWASCFSSLFVSNGRSREASRPLYLGSRNVYYFAEQFGPYGPVRVENIDSLEAQVQDAVVGPKHRSILREIFDFHSACQQNIVCHDF